MRPETSVALEISPVDTGVTEQLRDQDSVLGAHTEEVSVPASVGLVMYWLWRWEMQLWSQAAWVEIPAHT